jgi:hypothetical protein
VVDRELVDMLAMQEEIARSVTISLEASLADPQTAPDIDPRAISNPDFSRPN